MPQREIKMSLKKSKHVMPPRRIEEPPLPKIDEAVVKESAVEEKAEKKPLPKTESKSIEKK